MQVICIDRLTQIQTTVSLKMHKGTTYTAIFGLPDSSSVDSRMLENRCSDVVTFVSIIHSTV